MEKIEKFNELDEKTQIDVCIVFANAIELPPRKVADFKRILVLANPIIVIGENEKGVHYNIQPESAAPLKVLMKNYL
jgi:hypothetical protein